MGHPTGLFQSSVSFLNLEEVGASTAYSAALPTPPPAFLGALCKVRKGGILGETGSLLILRPL